MKPQRVADGVHRVLGGVVNAFVIESDDGLVLVDCGFKGNTDKIAASLVALGRDLGAVNHILVTHHHFDHTGSLAEVAKRTGARVYVHELDAPVVDGSASPAPPDVSTMLGRRAARLMVRQRAAPCAVDDRLKHGQVLPLADGIEVIHTPGHTRGECSFLLARNGGVLLAGDAANNSMGLRPYLPVAGNLSTEDLGAADLSFRRLASLDFEIAAFGHGKTLTSGASQRFADAVRRGRA